MTCRGAGISIVKYDSSALPGSLTDASWVEARSRGNREAHTRNVRKPEKSVDP